MENNICRVRSGRERPAKGKLAAREREMQVGLREVGEMPGGLGESGREVRAPEESDRGNSEGGRGGRGLG